MARVFQKTRHGKLYLGDSVASLQGRLGSSLTGQVQLLFTSPPFPLNTKKRYGNLCGDEYKEWFIRLAEVFSPLLTSDGSIVVELGNTWQAGKPVQSTLQMECLLGFLQNKRTELNLCQEFVCYNPSRLPSPAPWVTIKRIRTIDSFTRIWWMAETHDPKADNRRVLRPYSDRMKALLERGTYNSGKRPSQHKISDASFLKDNKGSIMPNVLEVESFDGGSTTRMPSNVLRAANSSSNDSFLRMCREKEITPHPARMAAEIPAFFIEFLTEPGDLVVDPFAGSNTTGFIAEQLGRRWISIEADDAYAAQSKLRFKSCRKKA